MARTLNGTGIRHFISFESQEAYEVFVGVMITDHYLNVMVMGEERALTPVEAYPEDDYFLGIFESDRWVDGDDQVEYERAAGVIVASWNVEQP